MSDHLPECYLSGPPNLCPMCEALRVCEQRVREEEQSHLPAVLFGNGDEKAVLQIRDMAYAAGVQAARDAVEALPTSVTYMGDFAIVKHVDKQVALAVIDALKEKP